MHYSQKADPMLNKKMTMAFICIFFTVFIHVNANAQDKDTICLQKNVVHNWQDESLNDEIDDMLKFFFYAQESYFSSHFTYSNDLETILRYGEIISPILSHQIMDSITRFRVESKIIEMSIFYNNDTLVTYKRDFNCQDFCSNAQLRNYVRAFDDKDMVIYDTNIFMEYFAQKQDLLVKLHEKYGFDVEMVILPVDECDIYGRESPLTVLFVYDSSGLIVHPIFDECKYHIENEYKQYLAQMADLLCSKYNASKIIFTSQIMCRK